MVKKKKDRMVEMFIKKGSHTFIHTKSPMTETKAARIGLKLIDMKTQQLGYRGIKKKKRR